MPTDLKKLLIIENDPSSLKTLKISLAGKEYEVSTADSASNGLRVFKEEGPKLILTDVKTPGMEGIEVLRQIKTLDSEAEVIVIADHGDMESITAAIRNGASDCITIPLRDEILMLALERARKKITINQQLRDYTDNLEEKVEACRLELEQAEEELIKSERLASIGETVAGLAHYIKNILQGLRGGKYMVNRGIDGDKPQMLREGWDMVQRNIERVSELVLDLLSYSKDRIPEPTACEPNEVVREVLDLYGEKAKENKIKLEAILDEELQEAYTDRNGLHRVFLNLVSNALDACIYDPDREKDWQVVLRSRLERDGRSDPTFLVEVRDNGMGMTDEVREKLFSRFFSTKGGEGTGLGLLVTQKIVRELGGEIWVESREGDGTTFFVRLKLKMPEEQGS